ncbi:uncharacterized protein LOC141812572 [Curcuma longa]|uniref:uncharacterized protein LOC141812572 n=1 Tax=Curcuma longa TaxID=136217 RepID=UPI003D9E2EA4
MSDSREGSPDWLRLFQPPSMDVVTVSSGSDSSPVKHPKRSAHAKQEPKARKNEQDSIKIDVGEENLLIKTEEPTDAKHENNQILSQDASSPNKKEPIEENTQEKPAGSSVSRLPLVFTDKVQRSKVFLVFESVDTRIEELRQEMTSGFAAMDTRFDELRQEVVCGFDRLTSLVE